MNLCLYFILYLQWCNPDSECSDKISLSCHRLTPRIAPHRIAIEDSKKLPIGARDGAKDNILVFVCGVTAVM